MKKKFKKEDILNLFPGTLFKIVEPIMLFKYSEYEYGILRTTKYLQHSYIMFLDKEKRENNIIRLSFFHHSHGILSRDIKIDPVLHYEDHVFHKMKIIL